MTEVVMPQMGESVAEGTIVRWLKKVGDRIERDEPLFEISTDKVDAEIPSPAAGVITEIRHKEGETVEIDTVVAVIGDAASQPAAAPAVAPAAAAAPPKPAAPPPPAAPAAPPKAEPAASYQTDSVPSHYHSVEPLAPVPPRQGSASPSASETASQSAPDVSAPSAPASVRQADGDEGDRVRTSPLVRRIAKEHNVDLAKLTGTGIGGRVTKDDILAYVSGAGRSAAPAAHAGASAPAAARPAPTAAPGKGPGVSAGVGLAGQTVPMSVMRKKIAEHMVLSRKTSAHVHSVFEVSFAQVEKIRQARKAEFERQGAKLTYLSFIIKATADALKAVPVVNSSLDGESVVYHKDVNIGIAVALDWGLIVPVLKNVDQKSLLDVSKSVVDLANRAREKKLKPEEVANGTFTITNPGVFGAQFGMPIINQPQVAILGIGAIEKRPVVIDDAIAIRHMAYLSLGYDHRVIDGAVADEFMSLVKKALEAGAF